MLSTMLSTMILWMAVKSESPVDRWFSPLFIGFQHVSTILDWWCRISLAHPHSIPSPCPNLLLEKPAGHQLPGLPPDENPSRMLKKHLQTWPRAKAMPGILGSKHHQLPIRTILDSRFRRTIDSYLGHGKSPGVVFFKTRNHIHSSVRW